MNLRLALLIMSLLSQVVCAVTLRDVHAMWLFDGRGKETLQDFSGRGLNGSQTGEGMRSLPGLFGEAIEFSGHGGIAVSDCGALPSWTLTAYVKLPAESGKWMCLLSNEGPSRGRIGMYLGFRHVSPRGGFATDGQHYAPLAQERLTRGEWHHVAVVRDARQVMVYVDGRKNATLDVSNVAFSQEGDSLFIGSRPHGWGQAFEGCVDELAIFRRALDAEEIADIAGYGLECALGVKPRHRPRIVRQSPEEVRCERQRMEMYRAYQSARSLPERFYGFISDRHVEAVRNIEREIMCPVKSAANPLIVKDRPWERIPFFTMNSWNVLYDWKARDFKCLYEELHARLLYAHSSDGLKFDKPQWNLVSMPGHSGTNVVLGDESFGKVHAPYVFEDFGERDSSRRYKMIYSRWNWTNRKRKFGTMKMAWSPDAIHWTTSPETLLFGGRDVELGDVRTVVYDAKSKTYLMYTRHRNMHEHGLGKYQGEAYMPELSGPGAHYLHKPEMNNKRRIFLTTSKDLVHWTELEELFMPGRHEGLDWEFYGMSVLPFGGTEYLGFLSVFPTVKNRLEVYLVQSGDGRHWEFVEPRKPFIPLGSETSWDCNMVNVASVPLTMGDETLVFYGGAYNSHDLMNAVRQEGLYLREGWGYTDAWGFSVARWGLGLARMKRNRYVALRGGVREGVIVTVPLDSVSGKELYVNARTLPNEYESGFVKVDVVDESGKVIGHYSKVACESFTGDALDHKVSWIGGSRLSSVEPVRLRFYLKYAELYGFYFK